MRIFFRTQEEIEVFLDHLSSLICPFCGAVEVVIRHGTIHWSHSPEQCGIRAWRVRCKKSPQCNGCGATWSIRVGDSLPRRSFSAMLEAVRDRKQVVGIEQVNRVLMQPHWRKDHDMDPL